MDFNDTPEEAAFRKEVRAWLDANATRKSHDRQSFRARNDDPERELEFCGVYRVAMRHGVSVLRTGARFTIDSEPGHGTTVSLDLQPEGALAR